MSYINYKRLVVIYRQYYIYNIAYEKLVICVSFFLFYFL